MKRASLFSLLLLVGIASAYSQEKPNIVFVYTDDQAAFAMGASGNDQIHTPHMDQLAREGARFTQAFVTTPVCSPSRATLMTGQYAGEYGITDWIHPNQEPELGLAPEAVTWAEVLQKNGYVTGLIGKWHLGIPPRFHPTRQGFDHFMGFLSGGNATENPTLEKNGEKQEFEGLTTDILTDHAIDFVKRNQDKRFLLEVNYRAPHSSYLPVADSDWAPYEDMDPEIPDYPDLQTEKVKRRTREYYASITGIDRNLGRLLDTLDKLDLKQETVVIFTSDHGYNIGHHGIWYKGNAIRHVNNPPPGTEHVPQRRRPNMFDTSLRVPCLVRWPGVVESGRVITQTVDNTDWYPTLLEIAGTSAPTGKTLRGESIVPLLKHRDVANWDNGLYGEYSMHHGAKTHMRMYRSPDWKLVRDFKDRSRDELYHLAEDPKEHKNLIDNPGPKGEKIIQRFDRKIRRTMRRIEDPVVQSIAE